MKLTGIEAIEYAELNGMTLSKYNDPTEDAKDGLTPEEARNIAQEDPSLIWITTHQGHIQAEHEEWTKAAHGQPSKFRGHEQCRDCAAVRRYDAFGGRNPKTGGGKKFYKPEECDYLPGDAPGHPSF